MSNQADTPNLAPLPAHEKPRTVVDKEWLFISDQEHPNTGCNGLCRYGGGQIYSWSDGDDEFGVSTQAVMWGEYEPKEAVAAGLATQEQSDTHQAREKERELRHKREALEAIQRQIDELQR